MSKDIVILCVYKTVQYYTMCTFFGGKSSVTENCNANYG